MKNMTTMTQKMAMDVQETQEAFIFSVLETYAYDNYHIVIDKNELARALQLIIWSKSYGPSLAERWGTATQNKMALDEAYMRGLRDGIEKEYSRIMDILEGEKR